MAGFQTKVTVQPGIGIEGDFASSNPRFFVLAGAGGLQAGDLGVTVGRFSWLTDERVDDVGAPVVVNNFGSGPVAGLIHREQQGLITQYLQTSSMLVPAGFGVTVMSGGDLVVRNRGANQGLPGMKAYANFADGTISFAPPGQPAGGGTSTASTIAPGASAFTGQIIGNELIVSLVNNGTLFNGSLVAGANVPPGCVIVDQLLPLLPGEVLRGVGRYSLNIPELNIPAEAMTGAYGLLTIGGTVAGNFGVGQPVSGGTTSAGTVITDLGTGTGGAGTYVVNTSQTVTSASLNTASNIETKWVLMSACLPGELGKITDHALG
jgi:hypothetical protein